MSYQTYYRLDSPIFGNAKNGFIPKEVWAEEIIPDAREYGGVFHTEKYTKLPIARLLSGRTIKIN